MTDLLDLRLPAIELAPALLGTTLVRVDADGVRRAGVIVETEAYPGGEDLASHSRLGHRSPRNESMYLAGGHLYVYLIYGIHHCLNVVSGVAERGEAVLIRAIRPTEGHEAMRRLRGGRRDRELARGPGRLAAALNVDRTLDGSALGPPGPIRLETGEPIGAITVAERVGIAGAGAWASRPWRFLAGDPCWWSATPRRSAAERPGHPC